MIPNAQVICYDTDRYPFARILSARVFKVPDLSRLHVKWKQQNGGRELGYDDNLRLRLLMERQADDGAFYKTYRAWITRVLAPYYNHGISYAAHPKMRVHLAGTGSVSKWHKDAYVTKQPGQINCYLPFTDVFATNTLWCESDYGSKDYQPLPLKYGEALIWDGGGLEHGTVVNDTDHTRISCDFRFSVKNIAAVPSPWSDILAGRPKEFDEDEQLKDEPGKSQQGS